MLISRLCVRKYPWANPQTYLIIPNTTGSDLDPVFAGRIAAFARSRSTKATCTSKGGRRNIKEQIHLYDTLPKGQAARPGTSYHEFGLGWDTADAWFRSLYSELATASQTLLLQYGIFKPLTKGNGATVLEPWHIQPVETLDIKQVIHRPQLAPLEYPIELVDFQKIAGITPDKIQGPNAMERAQEMFLGRIVK